MVNSKKATVVLRSVKKKALKEAVQDCLVKCDWESWVAPNAVVVIKPNCCTAASHLVEASNTDVAVVEALCEALLTRTNRIFVGESGHLRQTPWQAFQASGYVDMAKRLGIQLVNFSEEPTVLSDCPPVKMALPRRILESDAYINVPVLKTHALTYFTGALKNQWGCVPDCHDRLRHHRLINELLCSIQKVLKPRMVLVDAIVGMEGRGPVAGEARRLDAVLASRDAVAIDATAMRLVGLDPTKSRHVVMAGEKGLGRFAESDIEVDGEWKAIATKFAPPPRDIANRAMFFATQSSWFVKNILANDSIYYPVRDFVKFLRKAKLVAR